MRQRWLRIGLLAGIVFAINVVGRLVVRIGSIDDPDNQTYATLAVFVAIGLAMATLAIVWGRLRQIGEVAAELAAAAVLGGLLSLLVGPFVSGSSPAADGAGTFFTLAWQYGGFAAGGAVIGLFVLIMLGKDYKSRSLARYAESKLAKPRRPVRR